MSPLLALVLAGFLALGLISLTVPPTQDARNSSGAKFLTATHRVATATEGNALAPMFDKARTAVTNVAAYFKAEEAQATAQDLPETDAPLATK